MISEKFHIGYTILAEQIIHNRENLIGFINSNTDYDLPYNSSDSEIRYAISDSITNKQFVDSLEEYLQAQEDNLGFICGGACIAGLVLGVTSAVTAITRASVKAKKKGDATREQVVQGEYREYQRRKQQRESLKSEEEAVKERFLDSLLIVQKDIQNQYEKEQKRKSLMNNVTAMILVGAVVVVVPMLIYYSRKK
jgi:hypothetical protein